MNISDLGKLKANQIKTSSNTKPFGLANPELFQKLLDDAVEQKAKAPDNLPNFNAKTQIISPNDTLVAQAFSTQELEQIERRRRQDRQNDNQTLSSDVVEELNLRSDRLSVTPFQVFIERSVDALENISALEMRVNDLTEQYINGQVSIDEVSIEMTKLNLAISFATTVISTAATTFKELTQLNI